MGLGQKTDFLFDFDLPTKWSLLGEGDFTVKVNLNIMGIGVDASTEKSIFPENSQKIRKITHDPRWAKLGFFEGKLEFEARSFEMYRTDGQMITRGF